MCSIKKATKALKLYVKGCIDKLKCAPVSIVDSPGFCANELISICPKLGEVHWNIKFHPFSPLRLMFEMLRLGVPQGQLLRNLKA